ncbi:hypothetical protein [Lederbergia citrea]|uniref:Uncharacterized protein n=1 Tax=Lederbergia citrea TaxID=2833581 RepID=A0A942UL35_9BACI|nr:hypothetical protein [Lederbergia citrea]MBS4204762.1 hypothetical protein [Lederbergia citrea]MBS4223390.1 hypothetical protein [Lederbergia citrea]
MFTKIFNLFKGTKSDSEEPHFYKEQIVIDEDIEHDDPYEYEDEPEIEDRHYFY